MGNWWLLEEGAQFCPGMQPSEATRVPRKAPHLLTQALFLDFHDKTPPWKHLTEGFVILFGL